MRSDYELIDSGFGLKLERFGPYTLARPAAQAVWEPALPQHIWKQADATFTREGASQWLKKQTDSWSIDVASLRFLLKTTDFGHLGIFPEQRPFWEWLQETVKPGDKVLNLFAYSGGSTLASAKAGAEVCHLDASQGMCAWARENAALNDLQNAPIRWIVDDAMKFLKREVKRMNRYDAIILDPPTFGRGRQGEVFKIEEHIIPLLKLCREVLSSTPRFVLFSCHTPGFSPLVMDHLLSQALKGLGGTIDHGEMSLTGSNALPLPNGTFARWVR